MTFLNRTLQREILLALRAVYPNEVHELDELPGASDEREIALHYLAGHGLVQMQTAREVRPIFMFLGASITVAGLDFLEEDGGLTAMLGVVTVRLEANTIRQLIADRIEASDLPAKEKSAFRKHLESLSEAALKQATTELVKQGIQRLPEAIPALQRLLGLG